MGDDLTGERARVVAVVQARMSSTRLPGKVLAPLGQHTVLGLLLRRLGRAQEIDAVVVATSTAPGDDPVVEAALAADVAVVRGPLDDVLARYALAAREHAADAVVRITADCPLTDPHVVDDVVRHWRRIHADYVSNTRAPRSYPDGLDVEVLSSAALQRLDREFSRPEEREHVTLGAACHPERFSTGEVRLNPPLGDVRITLDTSEDLELLRELVHRAGAEATMAELLRALGRSDGVTVSASP